MDPTTAVLECITTAFELLTVQARRPRVKIAALIFDGTGDVELLLDSSQMWQTLVSGLGM